MFKNIEDLIKLKKDLTNILNDIEKGIDNVNTNTNTNT